MMPSSKSSWVAIFLAGCLSAHAAIDLNGNSLPDLWETAYNVSNFTAAADSDGDGMSNLDESVAGTDPSQAGSLMAIASLTVTGSTATVTWPSQPGKLYQLVSTTNLAVNGWTNELSAVAGTGGNLALDVPVGAAGKSFRVRVQDIDADGDGVFDWEELKFGYSPVTNSSFNGVNDYTALSNALQAVNIVSVTAGNPYAQMTGPVTGTLQIARAGNLNQITVPFALSGTATAGVDFATVPASVTLSAGVNLATITITPLTNATLATKLVTLTLTTNAGAYSLGSPGAASVVIEPVTAPLGTGLFGQYYNGTNFNTFFTSRVDSNVNFNWSTNAPVVGMQTNQFSVRWTGQVQPEFSDTYYFFNYADDGCRLWVDGKLIIDRMASNVRATTGTVALVAGKRYDLRLDYYENTGSASNTLHWWSESQTKQVIPTERLYPNTNAPTSVTSPANAVALVGGPFSYQIGGSNLPLLYNVSGLPAGLTFNPLTGLITGTPTVAGTYHIIISVGNGQGTSYQILTLTVLAPGGEISREYWTGIAGTSVTNIPVTTVPTSTGTLSSLTGPANFGDNYGQRIRGYVTAPTTGNYYFWLTATNAAELWISNDDEAVNSLRRCAAADSTAQSPWLALVAGERYYVEILHKAGTGTNDGFAVAWERPDALGVTSAVPGYVLSPYVPVPTNSLPGTLYATTMLAQSGAASFGVGTATLRVSADESQAILKFNYTNLTSAVNGGHIHSDPYLAFPSQIIFDIDDAEPEADGSYVWPIVGLGSLSTADIREIIKQGKAYINIHTVNYPNGEIRGNFTLADGSRSFTPPPAPPAWTDDSGTTNGAVRFLNQATFGAVPADIASVMSSGYAGWIDAQLALPASTHLPEVLANLSSDPTNPYPGTRTFNAWWRRAVTAPDQLRQRVAFALSEIMVVSESGVLDDRALALSGYYDMLLANAFGNVRQLLEDVTLHPAMGLYLDMRRNEKGDLALGRIPNENYAREILQLFSVGLYRMWPDGTLILNSHDDLIPTYDQAEIIGFARVFTGWDYYQTNFNGRLPTGFAGTANYTNSMVLVPSRHELQSKRILDNVVLPAASGLATNSANVAFDNYGLQELELSHDNIFENPNLGPFLCRQLIQRLVTSAPSRDYLYRVVQVFNDNGAGVRGDLGAVVKAILLDYEARSTTMLGRSTYGKQREPVLRVTGLMRAFPSPTPWTGTYDQNGSRVITITTATPHRLVNGNTVQMQFTSGTPLPNAGSYTATVTGPNTFTVVATGILTGSYAQVTNTLTITTTTHGLAVGNQAHLTFTTGGASNGLYAVTGVPTTTAFNVTSPVSTNLAGQCLIAFTTGGYTQTGSNTVVSTAFNHGLGVGDFAYIDFTSGTNPDGLYQVTAVGDDDHFTVFIPMTGSQTQSSLVTAPAAGPPLVRSGNVTIPGNTWLMNTTDTDLTQTPLRAPTVFNFFFPDYKFPGILAAAGLTTPEFQLTSDSNIALQHNFLAGAIINSQGANTNGLNSFKNGGGAVYLDIGPWQTTNYTSAVGIPILVDELNSRLMAGTLASGAKTSIVTYVTNTVNFVYSTPPTQAQMRDRLRAVIHLLVTSPAYTIQK